MNPRDEYPVDTVCVLLEPRKTVFTQRLVSTILAIASQSVNSDNYNYTVQYFPFPSLKHGKAVYLNLIHVVHFLSKGYLCLGGFCYFFFGNFIPSIAQYFSRISSPVKPSIDFKFLTPISSALSSENKRAPNIGIRPERPPMVKYWMASSNSALCSFGKLSDIFMTDSSIVVSLVASNSGEQSSRTEHHKTKQEKQSFHTIILLIYYVVNKR